MDVQFIGIDGNLEFNMKEVEAGLDGILESLFLIFSFTTEKRIIAYIN